MEVLKRFTYRCCGLFAFAFMAASCNKPDAPDCFQKAGEVTIEEREFDREITELEVMDVIDLILYDAPEFRIEVEGPVNLLSDISTAVDGKRLIIEDHNTCNFMRKLGLRYTVHVYGDFERLIHRGAGDVSNVGMIHRGNLLVENRSASGSHTFNIICDTLEYQVHTGTVDVTLTGSAHRVYLFNQGFDKMNARDLQADKLTANNSSINRMDVRASDYLNMQINSDGNIHYWGESSTIEIEDNGDGTVVAE